MKQAQGTIGQQIAQAARAFEKQKTNRGRKWVVVFMNEDTIVIALHGTLTAEEKSLARCSTGAAQIREFHRQLFAIGCATLFRKIKNIAGMEVRHTTAEIELKTGWVVQVFTTDTTTKEFLVAPSRPAGRRDYSRPTGDARTGSAGIIVRTQKRLTANGSHSGRVL